MVLDSFSSTRGEQFKDFHLFPVLVLSDFFLWSWPCFECLELSCWSSPSIIYRRRLEARGYHSLFRFENSGRSIHFRLFDRFVANFRLAVWGSLSSLWNWMGFPQRLWDFWSRIMEWMLGFDRISRDRRPELNLFQNLQMNLIQDLQHHHARQHHGLFQIVHDLFQKILC